MGTTPQFELLALSDSALLIRLGDTIDEATHARVRAVVAELERSPIAGVIELVPSYTAVAVHYSPQVLARADDAAHARIRHEVAQRLAQLEVTAPPPGKLVEVPVRYGGAGGPDLDEVAQFAGLTTAEVIRAHTEPEYIVYMLGFAPGQVLLGGVPGQIAMPRRPTPRLVVPAGSVGIGGRQTGIYSCTTPGGWNIIGRTELRLVLPDREPPTLFEIGDRVKFVAVNGA